MPVISDASWHQFATTISGGVLRPGSDAYEAARKVWNGMIDIHPAAIAICQTTDDVSHAVNFGREEGLEIAVYGGGHNAAGLAVIEDGLVIDLRRMRHVAVDTTGKTARVQGGATWSDVDQATTAHNLAVTGGAISTTGVGGLTLGGGIGNTMRQWGLACDNLIAAQVVLANGEIVVTNENVRSDLLWALKGGGGNFGVVTEFIFALHPMNGVYGGMILHPRDAARGVLENYRETALNAPDELGIFCGLLYSPDGMPVVGYVTWYNGTEEEAAGPMAPLKTYGSPMADLTAAVSYVAAQSSLDEAFPSGMQVYWKSHFLSGLPDEAIGIIVEHANAAPSPLSVTLLELLGGAVARVDRDATAFDHRDAPFNLAIIARWLDPAEADANIAWTRTFFDAMQPFASGVYVNYLSNADSADRVREAYGAGKYERLAEVKQKYDPDNLLHRNQNIAPVMSR